MFRYLLITALTLTLSGYSALSAAACLNVDGGVQVQTLYAGQSIDAGSVSIEVVDDDLVITYTTSNGWFLSATHLWVGTSIAAMPQTRKGSPKIGLFPYKAELTDGSTTYSEVIPLADLEFTCPLDDSSYLVAAHAVVYKPGTDGEEVQTETGWADGDRFVERGTWATFFSIDLTCNCGGVEPPPVVLGNCETAFAYSGGTNAVDGDITTSFLEIDEDEDGVGDFNRWGWTNGPVGPGVYSWDIYAGAGQSNINKGTLVGVLNVYYDGFNASVDYVMDSPYQLTESHLYVGAEILPLNPNNQYTVAPGQYPYIHESPDGSVSDSYTVSGLSGDVYIVAHGVSCEPVVPQ